MKIKQNMVGTAVAGAFLLASSAASALTITSYSSVSTWSAAVAASALYSNPYEIEKFGDGVTFGGLNPRLTITGPTVQLGVAADPFFTPGDGGVMEAIADDPSDAVTIEFDGRKMFAMGAHWNLRGPGGPGSNLTLNLVDGSTYTFVDYYPNTLGASFRGFVSDTAFSSIVLTEGTSGGGLGIETFQMDNLKYAQAVPEPETYAMLLAGLGLMGFVARRRKQSSKA